jgi:hypothetical protein
MAKKRISKKRCCKESYKARQESSKERPFASSNSVSSSYKAKTAAGPRVNLNAASRTFGTLPAIVAVQAFHVRIESYLPHNLLSLSDGSSIQRALA